MVTVNCEKKIQCLTSKREYYCASYCLYIFYLTKVVGKDFISAVLNLYYQRFSPNIKLQQKKKIFNRNITVE